MLLHKMFESLVNLYLRRIAEQCNITVFLFWKSKIEPQSSTSREREQLRLYKHNIIEKYKYILIMALDEE